MGWEDGVGAIVLYVYYTACCAVLNIMDGPYWLCCYHPYYCFCCSWLQVGLWSTAKVTGQQRIISGQKNDQISSRIPDAQGYKVVVRTADMLQARRGDHLS